MREHLQREIEKLKHHVLAIGAEVEDDLRMAVRAALNLDAELARRVIRRAADVDVLEVDAEEECLKILALHQPVAADLRYIVAVLKINGDLERIGDLAAHIAERSEELCELPRLQTSYGLGRLAEKAQDMLNNVLDAFVNLDAAAARTICQRDSEIDELKRESLEKIKQAIVQNPHMLDSLLNVMHIARHLERIADHATNIGEDLIYMVEGRIVRHRPEVSDSPVQKPAS